LDATVKSDEASRKGLSLSLFERVMRDHKVKVSTMLDVQYRMNNLIMRWSSNAMYEGQLKAHVSVTDRTMSDLISVKAGAELPEES
jgi:superfamily I DNA and/or RNA helicase